ncbi:methylated-DNA--[protein]-cysteine S-methyltransferase [Pseudogemmobacter bohemicus]|uniref:methylated-DNA--[protein]-cysteine S-methyltransferase n=1 Tax=Pseudogemmobacter bohemicus TaxID=2250708 RepID=UPI000DD3060B|nr:methylated-DNA--[protein]-cysteine S-methyltransferase [Pseudogemmobacter bohemicus]
MSAAPDAGALWFGQVATPIGAMILVTDAEDMLVASEYGDHQDRLHRLLGRRLGAFVLHPAGGPQRAAAALAAYFNGDLAAINGIPVRLNGSAFQNRAWTALRQIPPGRPASYGDQALRIGSPKAARAVGHANQSNPYNLVVPCHRVIGAGGALTGYAGGLDRKRWLLDHERRYAGL